ncbi:MAG: rhomboid family intramembrane serine protease [Gaiellaceae bacterium]
MATCYRHPDRETGLSCSVCGRPICTDCATFAPVGIRCPEHSGKPQGVEKITRTVRRAHYEGSGALVTRALIAINIIVYLATVATGGGINSDRGTIWDHGALAGPLVANGDYWRLLTSAFMHIGPTHLGFNMIVLWFVGAPLEERMGRGRFLLLYLMVGLAGSAGAILASPCVYTVGASGAIFGLFGAGLVLERQGIHLFGSWLFAIVIINLALTFGSSGISVGGHIGGLIGGVVAMLGLSRFGRTHALYGRAGVFGYGVLLAVGVISVVLAIWAANQGCNAIL